MAEQEETQIEEELEENVEGGEEVLDYETWLKEQGEDVRGMLETHTQGLKRALVSERENRKTLEKDIRKMAAEAEKGSEAQERLNQLADEMATIDRKANFYEEAHKSGARNLKLAYFTAIQDDLFDKNGVVDFATLKETYPELFERPVVPMNAGDGRDAGYPKVAGMNEYIRRKAGR